MSATATRPMVEPDILAAEFLLGLLDDGAAREFGEMAARDPMLARRVTEWSERLEPLTALAAPVAPTPALWLRIASELGVPPAKAIVPERMVAAAAPNPALSAMRAHPRAIAGIAALAVLVCVAIAVLVFGGVLDDDKPPITEVSAVLPPRALRAVAATTRLAPVAAPAALSPPVDSIALLDPPGPGAAGRPAFRASVLGAFLLRLQIVRPLPVPAGSELGVWVQPRSERTPVEVGRIAPSGGILDLPVTLDIGDTAIITAEPAGRPSRARPGPVLLQGRFGPNN